MAYNLDPAVVAGEPERARYERTAGALLETSKGKQILVQRGTGAFQGTVTYIAAERYGTAAHLFKVDTGLGPPAYHAQCVEALRASGRRLA